MEKQEITIYYLHINADSLLAPCVFSMFGAEELEYDELNDKIVDPFKKQKYIPKDGDLIITVFNELDETFPTAVARFVDVDDMFRYLNYMFNHISLYTIKINDINKFNPFDPIHPNNDIDILNEKHSDSD